VGTATKQIHCYGSKSALFQGFVEVKFKFSIEDLHINIGILLKINSIYKIGNPNANRTGASQV